MNKKHAPASQLYRIQKKMATNRFKLSNSVSSDGKSESDAVNIIEELKEKMSRLKFRLLDCQNQNQMLRKELLFAKKVVNNEVSPVCNENFSDVLHQAATTDYRGRREKILFLKDKLSELQNRIKEIEEGDSFASAEPSAAKPQKVDRSEDQKKFQNKQMVDKELEYLLENSCQMKRKLEVWKKRTAELSKEAELLRLELNRLLEKSKEDKDVHASYSVVEKELRARQAEKLDMRSKLDAEKTRNEQQVEELKTLKDDLSLLLSKINDDKVLTEALNNQKGYLHDLLERQKMISESDNRRFKDDLREIHSRHTTNCNMLIHLKEVVEEKNIGCQQVQETMQQRALLVDSAEDKEERITSASTITDESEQSQQNEPRAQSAPPAVPPPESVGGEPTETEIEITKLTEERDQHINISRSMYEEVEQLTSILSANDERINEWMAQLFQSRSLLAQKCAEVHGLEETAKRLQRTLSTTKKLGASPQLGSSFADEMKKRSDVLNEEYQFLLSLWGLLMTNKESSTFVFTVTIDSATKIFADAIDDLTLLEDKSNVEEQEQQETNEEPVKDETNSIAE